MIRRPLALLLIGVSALASASLINARTFRSVERLRAFKLDAADCVAASLETSWDPEG